LRRAAEVEKRAALEGLLARCVREQEGFRVQGWDNVKLDKGKLLP
jgi:hypothetical protein